MSKYSAENNDTELEVTELTWPNLQKTLETDKIDPAIMNPAGLRMIDHKIHPLYSEKYVILLPKNHALEGFETLTLPQLSGQNYVDRLAYEMRSKCCNSVRHLGLNSTPSSDLSAKIGFSQLSQPASGLPSSPSMLFWLKMSLFCH